MNSTTTRLVLCALTATLVAGVPATSFAQHNERPTAAAPHAKGHASPTSAHNRVMQQRTPEQCWLGTDGDHPYYGYMVGCDTPRSIHAN